MNNRLLAPLGFDEWFREAGEDILVSGFSPARVIEVNRNNFRVTDGNREIPAELSGRFMFDAHEETDFPTTGDWVAVQALDDCSLAVIHNVLPRKTVLKRKEPGKKIGFQLIAANIDYGLVVQSADAINQNSMERYLVMLNESGIRPMVVINKIDLLPESALSALRGQMAAVGAEHVCMSAISDQGISALSSRLESRKTYCLLGPSGVGKTSLLNRLLGEDLFKVTDVREKDGKGRHATVRRQLVRMKSGSMFIDTPGMRELGNFDIAEGVEQTFEDIVSYGSMCRFRDCSHVHEKGCAVIEAVGQGNIDADRYRNYLKLKKESAFYEMSYLERRNKDRAFGKMVKSYKRMKRKSI